MTFDCSWCTLKISNDNMYALMCLHANESEEEPCFTEDFVIDFLREQQITQGINHIAINAFLEHVMYEQFICVAQGTPPKKGQDGYFLFKKDTEDMKKKPVINEDGTADYKNSLSLAIIEAGEELAEYIPATKGSPGIDIFGKTLPALGNGKELLPLRGRGITSDSEKKHFYAEYSGHIVKEGNALYIDKLYRVKGDLNIEVGNIRFDGDVEVLGDVRSGMSIDAKGNIFIHGHVGACKLIAGENITIEKGIQGRQLCDIHAGGDIACKFVESCHLTAVGSIYADSVLNSSLTAQNKVIVTSKSGAVISSEIYGMQGVTVKEAGNNAGSATLLRSGLPRESYTRAQELTKAVTEIDSKLESFQLHLSSLEENDNSLPEEKLSELKTQIMRAKIVLQSNKKEYLEELHIINERIKADAENSSITITDTIHSGVRIYIGRCPYVVTETVREVLYRVIGGQVVCMSSTE